MFMRRLFHDKDDTDQTQFLSGSEMADTEKNQRAPEDSKEAGESMLEFITPCQSKGKEKWRSSASSENDREGTVVLFSPERKLYMRAIWTCEPAGITSPHSNHQLYNEAQKMAVDTLEGYRVYKLDE